MCEYCKKGKNLKDYDYSKSYYKVVENKLEHREDCIDQYYSYTESFDINYCPMCRKKIERS